MEQGPVAIFIDASVLFAASDSARSASREIVRYAQRGLVVLVVNKFVFEETERNLANKRPEALPVFKTIKETIPFKGT